MNETFKPEQNLSLETRERGEKIFSTYKELSDLYFGMLKLKETMYIKGIGNQNKNFNFILEDFQKKIKISVDKLLDLMDSEEKKQSALKYLVDGQKNQYNFFENNIFKSDDEQENPRRKKLLEDSLDSHVTPVVVKKSRSMLIDEERESAMEDSNRLEKMYSKQLQNKPLNKEDLIFLYEIEKPIKSLGRDYDHRIREIKRLRNSKEDILIILDYRPDEIACSRDEINVKTKIYFGPLFAGIFEIGIEHIYTKSPGRPIRKFNPEIGGRTAQELEQEFRNNKIFSFDSISQVMLQSPDFTTIENHEQINLVCLKVCDLFSDEKNHSTNMVYRKIKEFGLELCPAEAGLYLRQMYLDQPKREKLSIAMKPIADRHGGLLVFALQRNFDDLHLTSHNAEPDTMWHPYDDLVVCIPKKNLKT